jgi:hypothetical protein
MSIACLIGNGLSISYNPRLRIPTLTSDLVAAIAARAGTESGRALYSFARTLRGRRARQFEELLGPIEAAALALGALQPLIPVAARAPSETRAHVRGASRFATNLHRFGLGTALELISQRAMGAGDEAFEGRIVPICRALAQLSRRRRIFVGTLNYDGLLHAGFLRAQTEGIDFAFSDMAAGYDSARHLPAWGGQPADCWGIRTSDDLDTRVQLLNLHGSLGWLRDPHSRKVWKFELEDLRMLNNRGLTYWEALRRGAARMLPTVVLTDIKTSVVEGSPFELVYSIFEERLTRADRWLIAGCSLGDKPVVSVLKRALRRRLKRGLAAPRMLVISKGVTTVQLRQATRRTLGLRAGRLLVDTSGLPLAVGGKGWEQWVV